MPGPVRFSVLLIWGLFLGACTGEVSGPNRAPVALAGPDQVVPEGRAVELDGSASYDPEGAVLGFRWTVLSAPSPEFVLNGADQPLAQILSDVPGVYLVALVVNDGRLDSGRDILRVRLAAAKVCQESSECDDGETCTSDDCVENKCVNQALPDDTECGASSCAGQQWTQYRCAGGRCQEKVEQCDDGNMCTDDDCYLNTGCAHLPANQGRSCGVCQRCDSDGNCLVDQALDDDCLDPCTQCAVGGGCENQPPGSDVRGECPDELFCNGLEACDGNGACQLSGQEPCPAPLMCDEQSDTCSNCAQDSDCPPCDRCGAGGNCEAQAAGQDVKDECAQDSCHSGNCDGAGSCAVLEGIVCATCRECDSQGDCVPSAPGTPCDDQDPCWVGDGCDGAGVCQPGTDGLDADGDGHVDSGCGGDDCDDGDGNTYTGAVELCDGNDNACGGSIPQDEIDNDQDGYVECADWSDSQNDDPAVVGGFDCDDQPGGCGTACYPGAQEVCDLFDNDCDGSQDEGNYGFSKLISIDPAMVDGTGELNNFPLLVSMVNDSLLMNNVQSDQGYDIVFRQPDSACGVYLDHEIEYFDRSTGTLIAWVRIPSLSKTQGLELEMHYGLANPSDLTNPTGVWESDYKVVMHLDDSSTSTVDDSTANANHGSKRTAWEPDEIDGKIGKAQRWDGGLEYIQIADSSSLDMGSTFTAALWVNYNRGVTPYDYERMLNRKWRWNSNSGWEISLEAYYDDELTVRGANGSGSAGANNVVPDWAVSHWYHLVVVYDGSTASVYRDGVLRDTVSIQAASDNDRQIYIGRYGEGNWNNWYGYLDEIRLCDVIRSPEWILTSYNNQNDPGMFYSVVDQ